MEEDDSNEENTKPIIEREQNNNNIDNIEEIEEQTEEQTEKKKNNNEDENNKLKDTNERQSSSFDMRKKKALKDNFERLKNNLEKEENKNKSIEEIYQEYINNEDAKRNNIRNSFVKNYDKVCGYKCCFHILYFLIIVFTIINMIGIFQILSIMNIFFDVVKKAFKCYFNFQDEDENYEFINFYGYYIKESIDEDIDFDITTTMSFLGLILLNYSGFIVSSFVFSAINIATFFFIYNFYIK